MADAIANMIAAYRAAKLDEKGESPVKYRVVEDLEEHLAKPKALAFFLDLISDQDEYDLARVDALKILQLFKPISNRVRLRVGRRLANALLTEPDILVQQWMSIAAENFLSVPEVFAAISLLLADCESDLDVRHNCLYAFERLGPSVQTRGPLEALVADPEATRGKYPTR